jgi:hypothetical protein
MLLFIVQTLYIVYILEFRNARISNILHYVYAQPDNLYSFLSAQIAFRHKCNYFLSARVQILPFSGNANSSIRPWCNFFILLSSVLILHSLRMQILPFLRMQKLHVILNHY